MVCVSSEAELAIDAEMDSASLHSRSATMDLSARTSAFSASFSEAMAARRASSASSATSREASRSASSSASSSTSSAAASNATTSWRARSSRNEHCATKARRATVIRHIFWMRTAAASSRRRCRVSRYRSRTTCVRHNDWISVAAFFTLIISWYLLRAAYALQ